MNVKMDFSKSTVNYAPSWMMLDDAFNKMPWDCPYVMDANGNPTKEYIYMDESRTRSDNGEPWYSGSYWNSLHSAQYNYAKSNSFDFSGVLQLNVHFTDWLHFTTTNTFSTGYYKSSDYTDRRTYDATYKKGYMGSNCEDFVIISCPSVSVR